ncbi:class I SAM-dependent methyltransferase [Rhodoferax antarcticus]|uniref:class I SAM-dependent methyltransferase n=1 Tax=Rhodoferax antarcticus TaxID=81479 RepID=UPI00222452E4|nr:class I SAM-dependent methyltransferase [Rhodoferax antarcticus]
MFELVPHESLSILDVGCSNGSLGWCLKVARPNRVICGIEYDPQHALIAMKKLDYVVNVDLNEFDWNNAFANRTFDCIIFADVLEHLVQPKLCIQQALKFLHPNGCIIISVPNIRHFSAIYSIFIKGSFPQRDRGIFDRTHLRWFTISDAKEFLQTNGLNINSVTGGLRWGDVGGGVVNKILRRLPASFKNFKLVREFFTYQVCLRATLKSKSVE